MRLDRSRRYHWCSGSVGSQQPSHRISPGCCHPLHHQPHHLLGRCRGVLVYERWSGIIYFAVFLVMWCQAGKYADFSKGHDFEGSNLTAAFLSVFSIMYASSASWGSIIADFYVDYPVNTPWWRVAGLTMVGI